MKETIPNTKFNIYLSYPIDRNDNINFYRALSNYTNIGIEIGAYLIDWEKMDGLPRMYLYVPAEHETFITCAYLSKLLTDDDIIQLNCKIIEACSLFISFGGCPLQSKNTALEIKHADKHKVPIYNMPNLSDVAIDALKTSIQYILKG